MTLAGWLRSAGLLSRRASIEEVDRATVDNALRDNAEAFEKMHQTYSLIPKANAKLKENIEKAGSPFADLEKLITGIKQ